MTSNLPESDWQQFKIVHRKLLEKYCGQILEEIGVVSDERADSAHARYLKIFELIFERNKEMAMIFDDYRRSTALRQLAIMRRMELLTDEDLALFSEPTRDHVRDMCSV